MKLKPVDTYYFMRGESHSFNIEIWGVKWFFPFFIIYIFHELSIFFPSSIIRTRSYSSMKSRLWEISRADRPPDLGYAACSVTVLWHPASYCSHHHPRQPHLFPHHLAHRPNTSPVWRCLAAVALQHWPDDIKARKANACTVKAVFLPCKLLNISGIMNSLRALCSTQSQCLHNPSTFSFIERASQTLCHCRHFEEQSKQFPFLVEV